MDDPSLNLLLSGEEGGEVNSMIENLKKEQEILVEEVESCKARNEYLENEIKRASAIAEDQRIKADKDKTSYYEAKVSFSIKKHNFSEKKTL
jgi:hypothetical protein